ncbi:hypothetical protein SH449x_002701 [Pirellulaceae bacterium SH449]
MMDIDWDQNGYPSLHYERLCSARMYSIVAAGVTGCLFLCGITGAVFGYFPPLAAAVLGAVFLFFGLFVPVASVYDTKHYVQVIPYFQRRIGGIDTFLAGHTMVRYLEQLDLIAKEQNVKPISSFGFGDDLLGDEVVWHDPTIGLKSICAIQSVLKQSSIPDAIEKPLQSDLAKWQHALELAAAEHVSFCVLLQHGDSTSGHEWDVRRGSAF